MSDKTVFDFPGSKIDVQWDGRLCIHIGECGNAEGALFEGGRDPWCIPDKCSPTEVREVVERCPSGALTYREGGGEPEAAPAENTSAATWRLPAHRRICLGCDSGRRCADAVGPGTNRSATTAT